MKRGLVFGLVFLSLIFLSASLISAGLFSDFFGKITGNLVDSCSSDSECSEGYHCSEDNTCVSNTCLPSWNCGGWSTCGNNNQQTRTCTDLNGCFSIKTETQACSGSGTGATPACTGTDGCSIEGGKRCVNGIAGGVSIILPQACTKDTTNNCLRWSSFLCSTGQICDANLGYCVNSGTTTQLSITSSSPTDNTVLPAGTTTTLISVVTNKNALCRYSSSLSGIPLSVPLTAVARTDGTVFHSITVSSSSGSNSYSVQCSSGSESVSRTIVFTVSGTGGTGTNACTASCPSTTPFGACAFNQTAGVYQQTRTCTPTGCSLLKTEYQICIPTTQQACQWSYPEASQALCHDDGRKRILATAINAPCTGNPDASKCTATGGWKFNAGAIGWSCDLGSCVYNPTTSACGWNGCFPAVGQTDPNCKTPDGQIITNDPSKCPCSNGLGCFGTMGEYKNYACSLFEPSRGLRAGIANGDIQMAMIGLSNSCQDIQNSAGLTLANYLLNYPYFFGSLGSLSPGAPSSAWLERFNFVKALDTNKKALLSSAVSRACQNSGLSGCSEKMSEIGLIGDGYGSLWRQWRNTQALGSCFVYGIGSATIYGNGDIKVGGNVVGNAFNPELDLSPTSAFSTGCRNLLRGGAQCTLSNAATVCGTGKICHEERCCTPSTTAGASCPEHIAFQITCDMNNQQTRICGECNSLITEKITCVQPSVSPWPSGNLPCSMSTTTIGVFANRNSICRYSATSTNFDSMTAMTRTSPERTDTADFRAEDVPVRAGLNRFNIACKTVDGPTNSIGTPFSGTVSFTNPSVSCGTGTANPAAPGNPNTPNLPFPTTSLTYRGSSSSFTINSGRSAILNWSATNFTSCRLLRGTSVYNDSIYDSGGALVPNASGNVCVGCSQGIITSSLFTLSCIGPGGISSKDIVVNIAGSDNYDDDSVPAISNGLPTGTIYAKNEKVNISISTNENARCKYSTTAGMSYTSMREFFNYSTNSDYRTQHFKEVPVVNGINIFYIRCVDQTQAANKNPSDYSLMFIASTKTGDDGQGFTSDISDTGSSNINSGTSLKEDCEGRGCFASNRCHSFGFRTSSEYCAEDGNFARQVEIDGACANTFECKRGTCVEEVCNSPGLLKRFLEWLSRLFS